MSDTPITDMFLYLWSFARWGLLGLVALAALCFLARLVREWFWRMRP